MNNMSWPQVTLNDVCSSIQYGYTASANTAAVGPKFLRITDIVDNTIMWDKVPYCEIEPKYKDKYSLREGDIVVARTGATVGHAKQIRRAISAVFASYLVRFRILNDVEPKFIGAVIESADYKKWVRLHAGGAAQPNANARVLGAYPFALPPLSTQRRIASILSAYDDLIEVNRRRVAILEEMARRLFEEWFVHLRFPGHAAVPLHDTPDGPLPEGWHYRRFGELVTDQRDTVSPAEVDDDTIYVGLEHLPRRSTTLLDWGKVSDVVSAKLRFRRGDILFGKIRPYFHKVVFAPYDGVSSTDAIVLRSRTNEWAGLAATVASSDAFIGCAVQTSNGTKMPRANWSVLAKYPVLIPPLPLLNQFNMMVVNTIEQASALAAVNTRLAAARDLLLPRLLSGQLSIAEAPTPERFLAAAE